MVNNYKRAVMNLKEIVRSEANKEEREKKTLKRVENKKMTTKIEKNDLKDYCTLIIGYETINLEKKGTKQNGKYQMKEVH